MKLSARLLVVCLSILAISCGGGGGSNPSPPPPPPPSQPVASFQPATTPAAPNVVVSGPSNQKNTITLDITANSIPAGAYGIAFDLDFDPSIVTFLSSQAGTFFEQGGHVNDVNYQAMTSTGSQSNPGKLIVSVTRLGNIGGVAGSGTIVSLKFNVLNKPGQSSLAFSANGILDTSGQPMTGTNWSAGAINVQ